MPYFTWNTWDDNGEEVTYKLPAEWCICDYCRGEGYHSKNFGAFTRDDMDEWGVDADEFLSDYMSGRYDQRCEECNGTGKVLTLDDPEAHAGTRTGEILAEYWEGERLYWEGEAARAAERAVGC